MCAYNLCAYAFIISFLLYVKYVKYWCHFPVSLGVSVTLSHAGEWPVFVRARLSPMYVHATLRVT